MSAKYGKIGLGEMAHSGADVDRLVLTGASWFQAIDTRHTSQRTIHSGHALPLDARTRDSFIHVITSGLCVSEWRPSPDRRRVLELFCPQDIVQPASLPALQDFRIVSVMDTEILTLKPGALESVVHRDGAYLSEIITELGKRKQRALVHVGSLGGLTAEERVTTLFVELSLRMSDQPGDQSGFQMPLSRRDIADYLALNADTLSRILTRYKADGLFHQVGRDKIYIKNWQALLDQCPVADALLAEYRS